MKEPQDLTVTQCQVLRTIKALNDYIEKEDLEIDSKISEMLHYSMDIEPEEIDEAVDDLEKMDYLIYDMDYLLTEDGEAYLSLIKGFVEKCTKECKGKNLSEEELMEVVLEKCKKTTQAEAGLRKLAGVLVKIIKKEINEKDAENAVTMIFDKFVYKK